MLFLEFVNGILETWRCVDRLNKSKQLYPIDVLGGVSRMSVGLESETITIAVTMINNACDTHLFATAADKGHVTC